MKKKFNYKKLILLFLVLELFLAQTNIVLAETNYSGVDAGIKKYLCAPTDTSKNQVASKQDTGATSGMTDQNKNKEIQYTAGANNAAQNDLYECINKIYRFAVVAGGVIAIFFIVIAGYMYISSDGSQESVDKAKSILVSSITAMVILMSGYIFLKAINPDLIKFQNIQPPSVKLQKLGENDMPVTVSFDANGNLDKVTGGAGVKPEDFEGSKCNFNTDRQRNQAVNLSGVMAQKLKNICQNVFNASNGKLKANITSLVGNVSDGIHAKNSYHYKGCAVDFADGSSNFVAYNGDTPDFTKFREVAKLIYDKAIEQGITPDRINPGTDRTDPKRWNHIHIDLGSSCPNS